MIHKESSDLRFLNRKEGVWKIRRVRAGKANTATVRFFGKTRKKKSRYPLLQKTNSMVREGTLIRIDRQLQQMINKKLHKLQVQGTCSHQNAKLDCVRFFSNSCHTVRNSCPFCKVCKVQKSNYINLAT